MGWHEDLSEYNSLDAWITKPAKAVGWLSVNKAFARGALDEVVLRELTNLVQDAWSPVHTPGIHRCELCRFRVIPILTRVFGIRDRAVSSGLFIIPGDSCVYVSPQGILHYVREHGYLPPEEFCNAVLRCPPMRSADYYRAIGVENVMCAMKIEVDMLRT